MKPLDAEQGAALARLQSVAYESGRKDGRAEERAAIVAWLRTEIRQEHPFTPNSSSYVAALKDAADCIERGEHRKGGGK